MFTQPHTPSVVRRLRLWIGAGIVFSLALIASSICTYVQIANVAALWGSDASLWPPFWPPFWPMTRQVLVDLTAALVLLLSLAVLGRRFPVYLRRRELEQEIEIARSVQRELLPPTACDLDDFQVAGGYVPAAGVSGDFYDTFSLRGERVAFVLGDVSGKGVPAALLMGVLHGAVRSSEWTNSPLDHLEATRQMNRLLCERAATERFASMFWSYFNPESKHLRYINAGHCPPFLMKRSRRGPILRLTCGGPALGLIAGSDYDQGSVRLDDGDCLILYSDGIIKASNHAGEQFGEGRLSDAVRAHAAESAAEMRDHILETLDRFRGAAAPHDDRTLVVAIYLGSRRPGESGLKFVADRDGEQESRASARLRLHPDPPAVALHQFLAKRQADARAGLASVQPLE